MSRQHDIDANREIRRVMVRHWIDLGQLTVRTCNGVTHIGGSLERLPNVSTPLTPQIVETIFQEIGRITTVRRTHPNLGNWTQEHGSWTPIATEKTTIQSTQEHNPQSFEMRET